MIGVCVRDVCVREAHGCGGQSACLAPCRPGFESGWGDHAPIFNRRDDHTALTFGKRTHALHVHRYPSHIHQSCFSHPEHPTRKCFTQPWGPSHWVRYGLILRMLYSAKRHELETEPMWAVKVSWSSIMTLRFLAVLDGTRDKESILILIRAGQRLQFVISIIRMISLINHD